MYSVGNPLLYVCIYYIICDFRKLHIVINVSILIFLTILTEMAEAQIFIKFLN